MGKILHITWSLVKSYFVKGMESEGLDGFIIHQYREQKVSAPCPCMSESQEAASSPLPQHFASVKSNEARAKLMPDCFVP